MNIIVYQAEQKNPWKDTHQISYQDLEELMVLDCSYNIYIWHSKYFVSFFREYFVSDISFSTSSKEANHINEEKRPWIIQFREKLSCLPHRTLLSMNSENKG